MRTSTPRIRIHFVIDPLATHWPDLDRLTGRDIDAMPERFVGGRNSWIAQTFLQLVLLSVILYGQNLLSEKADARAEATFRNTKSAESRLTDILEGIKARGEENARMEEQNNEILKALQAGGKSA